MHHPLRIVLAGALSLPVIVMAGVSAAQPAGDVPRHRHFVDTGSALVPVGPQVCVNPSLQHAFNQFHARVHAGTPGTFAMDHEHNPTNIVALPGCG